MKKLVFAFLVALASVGFVAGSTLRAQDQGGQITIKDPAEYNAYQMFSTQTDPKQKSAAGEAFLEKYPQSVVKKAVLDSLLDAYQAQNDPQKVIDTANKLLQVDPSNMKAILYSVMIKKQQCGQKSDAATCDDAAGLAQKGLQASKPAETSEGDWKKMTTVAYPIFHSAIALDAALSKKDFKLAQQEYTAELQMYSDEQSKTQGLVDSLQLAQAYSQPGATQDLPRACYLYARVWAYAPPQYKAQIEPKLEYYYKKYHGGLDGLDQLKEQARNGDKLPPGSINDMIKQAKTPAEQIHDLIASTPDLKSLALADKETVLALGSKEDADKLWALLKDQQTQVPGIVISADANTVKVAVTQDAKDTKTADFVVNMKKPLTDADLKVIQPGFEFKTQPAAQLDGTYDSYTQTPATPTTAQAAVIVLRDGEYIPEKKKAAPVHHAPAHRPAH
jgi:hypothetical protein